MVGTGCVRITKLAAGFGYNRLLFVPQIDRLPQFPLMKMMHGEISAGQAATEMPARQGQYWLAAGIQFESYGMVRGDVIASVIVDYAKSERQFRVNGAAVPFPTAHQRRSLFIDFITLAHAYSVHSFQDGKNAFCQ